MYIPDEFLESDTKRILDFISQYSFATVVTSIKGVPFASHLPLLITSNPDLLISGHMAKANEQWRHFGGGNEVLIIFQGPHVYISPSIYSQPGVPTWNYVAIHVYGKARCFEDAAQLKFVIESLTNKYENPQMSSGIQAFSEKLMKVIVGFEVKVERIEAKYKLSQNRPKNDRINIIEHLEKSKDELSHSVALLMRENEMM